LPPKTELMSLYVSVRPSALSVVWQLIVEMKTDTVNSKMVIIFSESGEKEESAYSI